MILAHPWLLLAALALPALWWLLRATPPAPRLQDFPAVRLLIGLSDREQEQARTPPWLLALRLAALLLLIAGLAAPRLGPRFGPAAGGDGRVLLLVDDGWASAADWTERSRAAAAVIDRAGAAGRAVSVLATAPHADGAPPAPSAFLPAERARALLAALRPEPWAVARDAAAASLAGFGPAAVVYVADGVAGPGDASLGRALRRIGPVRELVDPARPALLMLPPDSTADAATGTVALVATLASAAPIPRGTAVLALDRRGDALVRAEAGASEVRPDGGHAARARFALPAEIRARIASLVVDGARTAASTRLLDEGDRARPVGILSDGTTAELPLVGEQYYLERALPPGVELRRGTVATLLSRPLSVMVAVDRRLADPADRARIEAWVRNGGTLIRFAGPRMAASDEVGGSGDGGGGDDDASGAADPLLPVPLIPGARALGGAMSWAAPQHLAPFPDGSPFRGLTPPSEVTVQRQVLARPEIAPGGATWVSLADGTPLVTARRLGGGRVVLFHVTANAEWSNLPLSGLFVQMLGRLLDLAAGVPRAGDRTLLAPVSVLDAFGIEQPPGPSVEALAADRFGRTAAGPRHPPGRYGGEGERRALDVADASPAPVPAPAFGAVEPIGAVGGGREAGPLLLAAALLLWSVDLLCSLGLRGLLGAVPPRRGRRAGAATLLLLPALAVLPPPFGAGRANAVETPPAAAAGPAPLPATAPRAALETELAYVVTGDAEVDRISREGLGALSDDVNARTAAVLGPPAAVVPGRDDLAFYPLLYWPILPGAAADPKADAALDAYMRDGGVVLIDTEGTDASDPDGGSGAGFSEGARAALRRVGAGLDIPPLEHLSPAHVLAHSFYLLRDFPGRFTGAPVWVSRAVENDLDGVSPVILGSNAWAAAWATGADGAPEFAAIPGGDQQRSLAMRFGVNLVIYALTGNYKADQVHVPALLERMGGDHGGPDAVGGGGDGAPDAVGPDAVGPDDNGSGGAPPP